MLRVNNTLSGKLESAKPREGRVFRMVICGPTVYDYIHLGHAKTYLTYDVLARLLRLEGYMTNLIMNITDLDQKVLAKATSLRVCPDRLASMYLSEFERDLKGLNISTVDGLYRVSHHVDHASELIGKLLDEGLAYVSGGNVYLRTSKLRVLGELAGLSERELRLRRLELDPTKRDPLDITLWKRSSEGPSWEGFGGRGRPWWHMQDVAVAMRFMDGVYDLHGGAVELVYPHHEYYRAILYALTKKRSSVRIWLHTGLMLRGGVKMSKSKGNVITTREVLRRVGADALRLYLLSAHYSENVNFSNSSLREAARLSKIVKRAWEEVRRKRAYSSSEGKEVRKILLAFLDRLRDDLDTGSAIRQLAKLSSYIVKGRLGGEEASEVLNTMVNLLGLTCSEGK